MSGVGSVVYIGMLMYLLIGIVFVSIVYALFKIVKLLKNIDNTLKNIDASTNKNNTMKMES